MIANYAAVAADFLLQLAEDRNQKRMRGNLRRHQSLGLMIANLPGTILQEITSEDVVFRFIS